MAELTPGMVVACKYVTTAGHVEVAGDARTLVDVRSLQ